MKKSISLLLCLALLSCFSLKLYSQSSNDELDQAELLKQFIGTWEAEIGQDSTIVAVYTPLNNGIQYSAEWKANGETFNSTKGLLGFPDDKKSIFITTLTPNGTMIFDFGRFVEKDKLIIERCVGNTTHASAMLEWKLITPESFVVNAIMRGNGLVWPAEWFEWNTFKKID